MKYEYLNFLKCPITEEDLEMEVHEEKAGEILSGKLFSSKAEFPITNGIPRFVKDQGYSDNFGWQWNHWAKVQFESENIGRPMAGYTSKMFQSITELTREKLQDKTILDIGCGPGRFTDVSRTLGAKLVIAIDYSSAIDAAKDNFEDTTGIFFVQGDALNLPFKEGLFDFAYSIGVLHHTPNPIKGVQEAARVLQQGGELAISVYKKGGYYDFITVQMWRKLFKMLWPIFGHRLPYLYSQIFGRINYYICRSSRALSFPIRLIFPSVVTLQDLRWSILDTFDSVTPSYQSTHTVYEVYRWFKETNFKYIKVAAWENIIGTKK
jgi:ubiquinone/menaquinone biosynthesis C-methylase UbiE/uncharacterized protein YbaR (Trm112 family)